MTRIIRLQNHLKCKVDDSDYDFLSQFKWGYVKCPTGIKVTTMSIGRKQVIMARLLLGLERGDPRQVDHKNLDTLDNRRCNIRIATSMENSYNKGPRKGRTFKGCYKRNDRDKWSAEISANHRRYHLGYFDTELEASLAYDQKARELHGEFARLNHD